MHCSVYPLRCCYAGTFRCHCSEPTLIAVVLAIIFLAVGLPLTMIGCLDPFWCPLYTKETAVLIDVRNLRKSCDECDLRCWRDTGDGIFASVCCAQETYRCYDAVATVKTQHGTCEFEINVREDNTLGDYGLTINGSMPFYTKTSDGGCGPRDKGSIGVVGLIFVLLCFIFLILSITMLLNENWSRIKAYFATPVNAPTVKMMTINPLSVARTSTSSDA